MYASGSVCISFVFFLWLFSNVLLVLVCIIIIIITNAYLRFNERENSYGFEYVGK